MERGDGMVRGVNKRIIEITNTGNDSFERVFVVLKEGLSGKSEAAIGEDVDRYVRDLVKNHRAARALGESTLPFAVKKVPTPGMTSRAETALKVKSRKDRSVFWFVTLILALTMGILAIAGLITFWLF